MANTIVVTPPEAVVRLPSWMAVSGWFVVGWSHEVTAGSVVPVRVFGQDIALYRTASGDLNALDAHCGHLGANLAYGGKVENGCIVCPFHGWTWNGDGVNVAVPEGRISKRRIGGWPVCERNGVIYVWHDVTGGQPRWSMPDLFDDLADGYATNGFSEARDGGCFDYGELTIEPRVVAENIVDPMHFRYVHHTRDIPELVGHHVDDSSFMTRLRVPSRGKRGVRSDGRDDVVTLKHWGVGTAYTRFSGRDNTHSVISVTPVDSERSILRQTLFLENIDGETDETRIARMAAIESVFPEDLRIWQHQKFVEPPALLTQEAKMFRALRRWAHTFEPTPGQYGEKSLTPDVARAQ